MPADENIVSAVFITEFNGKRLRLYTKQVEAFQSEVLSSETQARLFGKWRTVQVLEFINDESESLWKFPKVGALSDLLDAVQYRVAGVSEFLAEIEALAS
ncbi:MAG: hypothetical protein ACRD9R_04440 [Pyrinomonadaceae bacterium]